MTNNYPALNPCATCDLTLLGQPNLTGTPRFRHHGQPESQMHLLGDMPSQLYTHRSQGYLEAVAKYNNFLEPKLDAPAAN